MMLKARRHWADAATHPRDGPISACPPLPPPLPPELPLRVLLLTVTVPLLWMPPPKVFAELPERVLSLIVSVPPLPMPPPPQVFHTRQIHDVTMLQVLHDVWRVAI